MSIFASLNGKEFFVEEESVRLRGLLYREYLEINEAEYSTKYLFCYDVGKMAIENIRIVDSRTNSLIEYDKNIHFDLVFEQNFILVEKCVNIIIDKLTLISEKEDEEIQSYLHFSNYLSKNKDHEKIWDCKNCIERKRLRTRKCKKYSEDEVDSIMSGDYLPEDLFPESQETVVSDKKDDKDKEDFRSQLSKRKTKALPGRNARSRKKKEKGNKFNVVSGYQFYKWDTCPVSLTSSEVRNNISVAAKAMTNEVLLVNGAIMDQPMKFIEYYNRIKSINHDIHDKEMDAMKRESEKKHGR